MQNDLIPIYTETSLLTIEGKHKYKMLCNVPSGYLINLYQRPNKTGDPSLDVYIKDNLLKLSTQSHLKAAPPVLCSKLRFTTEEEAIHALNQIKEAEQQHKKPFRAYKCDKCFLWHLSSKPAIVHTLKEGQKIDFGRYEGRIFDLKLYIKDISYWEYLLERNIVSIPFSEAEKAFGLKKFKK